MGLTSFNRARREAQKKQRAARAPEAGREAKTTAPAPKTNRHQKEAKNG